MAIIVCKVILSPSAANCFSAARGLDLRPEAPPPPSVGVGESVFMVIYEAKVACTCVTRLVPKGAS